jgi:hypothetical protein
MRERQSHAERDALAEILEKEGRDDLADKLAMCGSPLGLTCTNCGAKKAAFVRCRRRWCPSCAAIVAAKRSRKYARAAKKMKWPLFLTLTVPNSDDPESLRVLRKDFGRFRRRKLWKDKVKSGIVGVEVTAKTTGWHPHLHCLIDCRWLSLSVPEPRQTDSAQLIADKCRAAQAEVAAGWADVCGHRRAFVWIRRADARAVREVIKYTVKGSTLANPPPSASGARLLVSDLIDVLERTRSISAFGELYGQMGADDDAPACECEECHAVGCYLPDQIIDIIVRI